MSVSISSWCCCSWCRPELDQRGELRARRGCAEQRVMRCVDLRAIAPAPRPASGREIRPRCGRGCCSPTPRSSELNSTRNAGSNGSIAGLEAARARRSRRTRSCAPGATWPGWRPASTAPGSPPPTAARRAPSDAARTRRIVGRGAPGADARDARSGMASSGRLLHGARADVAHAPLRRLPAEARAAALRAGATAGAARGRARCRAGSSARPAGSAARSHQREELHAGDRDARARLVLREQVGERRRRAR